MNYAMLKKKVLEEIVPSKEQERKIFKLTKEVIKRITIRNTKILIGGSLGKGTWLKNVADVDIYVKFDIKEYNKKDISQILLKELKKKYKVDVVHGSRDYFHIFYNGLKFEIIPILDIKIAEEAENITDISPLHVKWVKKHKKLANEIRLTKQFCKANGIYGAESYIRGFSGYVVEILTVHHKSFLKLVKSAAAWSGKTVIDTNRLLKDPLREMNRSKIESPLVIVDPVQEVRNASATVSNEKYNLFIKICRDFLRNMNLDFFIETPFDTNELKAKASGKKLILMNVKPMQGKVDVIGAKILKVFEHLRKQTLMNGFNLIDSGWSWDKEGVAILWFITANETLPLNKKHMGPPIKVSKRVENFREKHQGLEFGQENNCIYVMKPLKFRKVEDFMKDMIETEPYILDKVKEIKFI